MSADALLHRVQEVLAPKVEPEVIESFFVNNGIKDTEELVAMLDEAALMECGISRAVSRVAIARITAHVLAPIHNSEPCVKATQQTTNDRTSPSPTSGQPALVKQGSELQPASTCGPEKRVAASQHL